MKNTLIVLFVISFVSCGPSTKITRSWTSPEKHSDGYQNIYIAAVVDDVAKRQIFEDQMRAKLLEIGVQSQTSSATIRPNFWMSTELDKNAMMEQINKNNHDGILTMTLIDVQNEQRYIPGTMMMGGPMMMGGGWGMAGNFGGYWGMHHPMMMTPGQIVNDRLYFIEINMYDAKNELLVWSAQSESLNPSSLDKFSSEFSDVVLNRMIKEGVVRKRN
jgi:hypothetical protein